MYDMNGAPFAVLLEDRRKELWFYRVGVEACLCRSSDVWFVEFFIEKRARLFV